MRTSIGTWVIAAAMVAAPSAVSAAGPSNSGSSNSHNQIVNMSLGNLIAPAILNNPVTLSAVRNNAGGPGKSGTGSLGPSVETMRPVGTGIGYIGQPGEVARPSVGRDRPQNHYQPRGKRNLEDRLDITDKTDGKTVEAAEKTDAKNSDAVTRIAANTTDDSPPAQKSATRAITPPPTCR